MARLGQKILDRALVPVDARVVAQLLTGLVQHRCTGIQGRQPPVRALSDGLQQLRSRAAAGDQHLGALAGRSR
jgi:hypothetical protein